MLCALMCNITQYIHRYRLHRPELDSISDPEQRHRRLVELNVVEQCINLFKTGAIQRRRVQTYKKGKPYTTPRVHACVFEPTTGEMRRLDVRGILVELLSDACLNRLTMSFFLLQVDFSQYISELHEIYDLYTPEDEVKEIAPHAPERH